jgi:30S ribosomal protein S17
MSTEKTAVKKTVRTLVGKVVSDKMDKTVTVLIERQVSHPLYKKYVRKFTKIHAHDPENTYHEGDVVRISETRPIAKTKAWQVTALIEKAKSI